ncbi:MAG: LysR family transcriptional regulator [Coriobacteriales bacterium]|jgi:DNA-binding transcriptional LysR family regulator|nr:LysR family transcriptional regulator [Coriobacteriales bacterium]
MKIETLNEFIVLVKHKNYSHAAKELYCSQPNLSNHMAQLEKELGFRLFSRHANHLSLTVAGSEFLKGAQSILNTYEKTTKRCLTLAENIAPVRVQSTLMNSTLHKQLRDIKDIPYDFIDVDFGMTVFKAFKDGLLDIGFDNDFSKIPSLVDEARSLGLAWLPFDASPVALCFMRTHPLAKKQPLSREDLRGAVIVIQNGQHFDRWKLMLLSLLGDDLELEFVLNPVESYSSISLVDFGETVYICGRSSVAGVLAHRDDVVICTELSDLSLDAGSLLLYREDDDTVAALVKRLIPKGIGEELCYETTER